MPTDPLDVFLASCGPSTVESLGGNGVRRFPTAGSWRVFDGAAEESQDALRIVRCAGELGSQGISVIDLLTMWESAEATGFFALANGVVERGLFFVEGKVAGSASTEPDDTSGTDRRDRILDAMLMAESGLWTWSTVPEGLVAAQQNSEPLSSVLMDALRRQDEARVYRRRLRSTDQLLVLLSQPEPSAEPLQQRLAAALSDSPASLFTLSSGLHVALHDVLRAAYDLSRAGCIAYQQDVAAPAKTSSVDRAAFVNAFEEVSSELGRSGAQTRVFDELRALASSESGEHAQVWRSVVISELGALDLAGVPATLDAHHVSEALAEFVLFAAMSAARGLGRRRGRELMRRVRLLLAAGTLP